MKTQMLARPRKVKTMKDLKNIRWTELVGTLPGGELVRKGLEDLESGKITAAALLVQIGGPRLRSIGFQVQSVTENPEHALYDLLATEDSDAAHSRYNALIRTLVSFERAAECAVK
jgi:hypothetical protein